MAQNVTFSDPKLVTIDGEKYEVRTVTQWSGGPGTINTGDPVNTIVQYKPGPTLADPSPQFRDLAERTNDKNTNNGWSFRPIAGPGFKQELVKTGPTSLSSQLDTATQNAVAKDAKVPLSRAQQALSGVTPTKTNQALSAPNQDPTAAAANQNASQAAQNQQEGEAATEDQIKGGLGQFDANKLGQAITDGGIRASYGGGKNGGYYIYPIDMNAKQDRIKFTMYRYAPKKVDISNISASTQNIFSGPNTKGSSMGTVYLPIQPSIIDSNTVDWGPDTLNSLDALGATAAYGAIQGGGEALGEAGQGIANLIAGSNNDIKAAITAGMSGAAVNKSFLTRATGGIINPNLELLFGGPSLRSFNFTFDMSARSEDEAKEIRRIIRFFKQGMSVKRSASFLFLKTPNVFDIEYQFGASPHTWLNKFKTCALTNCIVNYTPSGNYATYTDGAMTQYNMTLTFGEIDPIYDDDYGTADNTQDIGY